MVLLPVVTFTTLSWVRSSIVAVLRKSEKTSWVQEPQMLLTESPVTAVVAAALLAAETEDLRLSNAILYLSLSSTVQES